MSVEQGESESGQKILNSRQKSERGGSLKPKKSKINEDRIQEGVYQRIAGPSYETVVEMKMAQSYGVDTLGMSTVYEVVAARQCGLKCLAISLITNECKTSYDEVYEVSHEEVMEVADKEGSIKYDQNLLTKVFIQYFQIFIRFNFWNFCI